MSSRDSKVQDDLCKSDFPAMVGSLEVLQLEQAEQRHSTGVEINFVNKLQAKVKKSAKPENPKIETCGEVALTSMEMNRARKLWVRQAKMERFPKEIKEFRVGKEVNEHSHFKPLIMGELGMLQVGGQPNRAEVYYDATHDSTQKT